MSLQSAQRFLARISQNPNLQTYLEASAWDARRAVQLARAFGYRISTIDLQTAIDETWGILSEEQLIGVTGGGGNGRSGSGRVTTVPGSTGTEASSGGGHTPPPGDVSGNSCFFSRSK